MKNLRKETSLKALKKKPLPKIQEHTKLLTRRASKALLGGGQAGETKRQAKTEIKSRKERSKNFSAIKIQGKVAEKSLQKKIQKQKAVAKSPKKQPRMALKPKKEEAAKSKHSSPLNQVVAKPEEEKQQKSNKYQHALEKQKLVIPNKKQVKENNTDKDKQPQLKQAGTIKKGKPGIYKNDSKIAKSNATKKHIKKSERVNKEKKLKKDSSPPKKTERIGRKIAKKSTQKQHNNLENSLNKNIKAHKNTTPFVYEALPQIIQQPSIDVKKFENLADNVEKLSDKTTQLTKMFNDLTEKMNGSFQTFSNSTQKAIKPITTSNNEILKAVGLLEKKADQSDFIKKIANLEKSSNEVKASLTSNINQLHQENKKLSDTLNLVVGNLEKLLKAPKVKISEEKTQAPQEKIAEDKQKKIKKKSPVKSYNKASSPLKNKAIISKEKITKLHNEPEKKNESQSNQLPRKEVEHHAPENVPKKIAEQEKSADKVTSKSRTATHEQKSNKKEEPEPVKRESKSKTSQEKSPFNAKDAELKPVSATPVKDFKIQEVKKEETAPQIPPYKESDSKTRNIIHIDDEKKNEQNKTIEPVREQKDISFGFPFDTKKSIAPPVAKLPIESEKINRNVPLEKAANQDLIVNFNARVHSPAEASKQEKSFSHGVFAAKPAEKIEEDKKDTSIYQTIRPNITTTTFSATPEVPKVPSNNTGDISMRTTENTKNMMTESITTSKSYVLHQPPKPVSTTTAPITTQEQKQPVKVFFDKTDESAPSKTDNFLASSLDQGAKSAEKKNFFS